MKLEKQLDEILIDDLLMTSEVYVPDASSGDGIIRTSEQCQEWAENLGCICIEATDKQLFIDIDTPEQFDQFMKGMYVLRNQQIVGKYTATPSKSGFPHAHMVVNLMEPQTLMTRIALQAALGSDPMREALSIKRALDKEDNVVIFFEKKGEENGRPS